ncbi:hypothetical protein CORC01_03459 [Colletotrichum orchidophilum]|uniref:Uncharacterized protein n=1 Tax=Colletotrichum orchidophilum TaxID=1209926 RepID=A0A1G4BID0_9PEZI|nr:uncharacterized protein CORC01_03459 [Colletotrichum orchidophilum]OHF01145.1 hypothetical protein CORC01_03459 [Colletotrichum orchidophilum]
MRTFNLAPAAATALTLLFQGVAAVPAPTPTLVARADVIAPTAAWISVNNKGVPTTVTPISTTISGTATYVSAAPNALTGSVFTLTDWRLVKVTTSTGTPPVATADSKSGAGAFAPCSNTKGDFSPFCDPNKGSTLFTDGTYYVTWDPTVLIKGNKTNVNVKIQGKSVNGTKVGDVVFNADTDTTNPASYGYYAWTVSSSLIPSGQDNATIELLMSYTIDGAAQTDIKGPQVLIAKRPTWHPEGAKMPKGAELYIVLPTVFGFIIICVIGGCLWNRRTRKIGLGNIMSRSRHGYGVGKSRAQRLGAKVRQSVFHGGRKDRGIQLRQREISPDGYVYRDEPLPNQHTGGGISTGGGGLGLGHARRDSEALGSLAGSPVSAAFPDHGTQGGNAFREEMRRQERERY